MTTRGPEQPPDGFRPPPLDYPADVVLVTLVLYSSTWQWAP